MRSPNILLLGASGRTGRSILRQFSSFTPNAFVHAFVRDPSKLSISDKSLCASIHQGDATNPLDIESALLESNANVIIVSIGESNNTIKSDVLERSSLTLLSVLNNPLFANVKVLVVSAFGAGNTEIDAAWGVAMTIKWMTKDVMADHDKQEKIIGKLGERVMIVRPTALGEGEMGKGVVEFRGKPGRGMVQRDDFALWVVKKVHQGTDWGKEINVTGLMKGEGILSYLRRELF